jgi:hypothetical protein
LSKGYTYKEKISFNGDRPPDKKGRFLQMGTDPQIRRQVSAKYSKAILYS